MTLDLPTSINHWLEEQGIYPPYSFHSLSGGCINQNLLLDHPKARFFIKTHPEPPKDFFLAEAISLQTLKKTQTFRIPEIYFHSQEGLILEYIDAKAVDSRNDKFWKNTAESLFQMHQYQDKTFGFEMTTYCGFTPQPNERHFNGHEFFMNHRLIFQGDLAYQNGLITKETLREIHQLSTVLERRIPTQSASLVHGDLWSGNIFSDGNQAVLIDPAAYYGWAETDLAMTALFGGFPPSFYQHYLHLNPESKHWKQRQNIYNLYHMLNHLNLFGSSYLSSVLGMIQDMKRR